MHISRQKSCFEPCHTNVNQFRQGQDACLSMAGVLPNTFKDKKKDFVLTRQTVNQSFGVIMRKKCSFYLLGEFQKHV